MYFVFLLGSEYVTPDQISTPLDGIDDFHLPSTSGFDGTLRVGGMERLESLCGESVLKQNIIIFTCIEFYL